MLALHALVSGQDQRVVLWYVDRLRQHVLHHPSGFDALGVGRIGVEDSPYRVIFLQGGLPERRHPH